MKFHSIPWVVLGLAFPGGRAGAQSDSSATRIAPVVVTVARGAERSVLGSPFAITVARPDSARPGLTHADADQALALIPGVSAISRNNPSQDPRISIRGFGSRSAFGVRGVRVLRDGIPLTLPDGQTPVDYLSLESVGAVEVLRGSASALYGNGSGGVIDFRTITPAAALASGAARSWLGTGGSWRNAVAVSGTSGRVSYVGDLAHTDNRGQRDHSRQVSTVGFARAALGRTLSVSLMALDNPVSENPGALTLAEMRTDPQLADPLSVRRNARKSVRQVQLAVSAERPVTGGRMSISAFGGGRTLRNPLTFAIVDVDRSSFGVSGSINRPVPIGAAENLMTAGFDFQAQDDRRANYTTCIDTVATAISVSCPYPGSDRGTTRLNQREQVHSIGAYISEDVALGNRFGLTLGARVDNVRFSVRDRLISETNPDDSGARTLSALSSMGALLMRLGATHSAYANVSTAFETPTATELGNQGDGSAGLNADLDPQRSLTAETGVKGWIGSAIRYDIAVFDTRVRDELIPFEIPASNGRRFFRNAGRTRRQGAEFAADLSQGPAVLMLAYSYSAFRFEDYVVGNVDLAKNEIPGIPRNRLQAALRVGSRRFAVIESEVTGHSWLDDANTAQASGFAVTHLRAGAAVDHGKFAVCPGIGIDNIFDRIYASSLAVNAARGRFYEPALRRTFRVGVSVGTSCQ